MASAVDTSITIETKITNDVTEIIRNGHLIVP